MIKAFIFKNYKSFENATLYIEELTTLIGANASGKSNALEGIRILSQIVTGRNISDILDGMNSFVKGGSQNSVRKNTGSFTLGCILSKDDQYDIHYEIQINVKFRNRVEKEEVSLVNMKTNQKQTLMKYVHANHPIETSRLNMHRELMITSNDDIQNRVLVMDAIEAIVISLRNIYMIDPIVSSMRSYSNVNDLMIKSDCSNISSILKQVCEDEQKKEELLSYISDLPENKILNITFEVTKFKDVIFAISEKYGKKTMITNAGILSDGTLRCIAMLCVALYCDENSLLMIEEIDNGIHPGRVYSLIQNLSAIASRRHIDILLTTHNASLMNQYNSDQIAGVSIVYREPKKDTSQFIPFLDIDDYFTIMAKGGLGYAMVDNSLIEGIKQKRSKKDLSWLNTDE